MPESLAEFRERVLQITAEAEADPARHRLRVIGMVVLAYGYLLGVIVLLVVVTLVCAAAILFSRQIWLLKLLVPLVLVDIAVIGSLAVRVDPPSGRELEREEAPALFAEIDRVRLATRAPGVHRTLVVPDLNAAVVQHPTFGIFGGTRNYLILGLPLLQGLDRAQFVSVLAHEFGHLSGSHGHFSTWIYRVRSTWAQLFGELGDGDRRTGLFRGFFEWFAPRFSAATFVLARQQEYEADRRAAASGDEVTAAATLVRLELLERRSRAEFWPAVERRAGVEPDPPTDVMAEQARFCLLPFDPARAARWCDEAMLRPTDVVDTHPALRDRLAALGVERPRALAGAIAPLECSAAEELLGAKLPALQLEMGFEWRGQVGHQWRVWRKQAADRAEALAPVRAKRDAGEALAPEEEWQLVEGAVAEDGLGPSAELVRRFVAAHPGHARGLWMRASLALEEGDESGLADLEELLRLDDEATLPAGELAYGWLQARGRTEEADAWSERMDDFRALLVRDAEERARFVETDDFDPADADPAWLEALRGSLQNVAGVAQAWMVRKRLTHRPHVPLFVLVCIPRREWWGRHKAERRRELVETLASQVPLPPNSLLVLPPGDGAELVTRLRRKGVAPLFGE